MDHADPKQKGLKKLARHLERPMLVLGFVWLLVVISELVNGVSPALTILGTALWALFVIYFGLRFLLAVNKGLFLRRNWLFIIAILVPALRLIPFLESLPLARALTATAGIQIVWIFASADQGLRSLRRSLGNAGVSYVLTFTVVVLLAGAAGMFHFEQNSPGPQGIHTYPKALWWVAMQMTNIGSGFLPMTSGGQVLALGISIFAFAMFGYLTAIFAAFFIGQKAKDPKSEIPNQKTILQLADEVTLLRKSVEEVLKRIPAGNSWMISPPPQIKKENQG